MNQNEPVTVYVNCKLYIGALDLVTQVKKLQEKYMKKHSSGACEALHDLALWVGEQIPKEINGQEQA